MSKQDKLITLVMISLAGLFSLLALPETITHISADATSQPTININHFADINLQAKAVYVYDVHNDTPLFTKSPTEALPLASLTKIMTAVTAAESVPPSTMVTISAESLQESGDSGLFVDERWNLHKLLQFMLVSSSNDGALAVASSFGSTESFVRTMNEKAATLGLKSMTFANPSGLDINETTAGAYGSAEDVAKLLSYANQHIRDIIEPTRYNSFTVTSLDDFTHTAVNTDIIAGKIPGLMSGKTGYTVLAGGNLAIVFNAGIQRPIVVVVLGSTYDGRFTDVEALINASIKTITGSPI
jgi:D-alanyl-D-alanine carboxypeptidase